MKEDRGSYWISGVFRGKQRPMVVFVVLTVLVNDIGQRILVETIPTTMTLSVVNGHLRCPVTEGRRRREEERLEDSHNWKPSLLGLEQEFLKIFKSQNS